MAVEQPVFNIGICKAAADLRLKQFHCVKVTTTETVNLTGTAGEVFAGVLQNKPNTNEVADVMAIGITKVKIGVGGLTAGATWEAAADGTAIATTSGKASAGQVLIGGSAGEIATVTIGAQVGGAISNAIVGAASGKMINGGSVTISAAQASANSVSIAHGLTTPASWIVQVVDTGNNVVTSDADVTLSGANLIVADGSTYNTVENYIIRWIAFGV